MTLHIPPIHFWRSWTPPGYILHRQKVLVFWRACYFLKHHHHRLHTAYGQLFHVSPAASSHFPLRELDTLLHRLFRPIFKLARHASYQRFYQGDTWRSYNGKRGKCPLKLHSVMGITNIHCINVFIFPINPSTWNASLESENKLGLSCAKLRISWGLLVLLSWDGNFPYDLV